MKKHILAWLLTGWSCAAYAQIIRIQDRDSGLPVDMVTLLSTAPRAMATTNESGQASLTAFVGADTLTIRRLGYKEQVLAFAQLERAGFVVVLEPLVATFDELVVSATRWTQSSRNIPSRIAVRAPKDVALLNPQTAADLLGSTGEVFIQKSQQGGGSPMIRGFSANRLLYTVDGVRMNSAIFRAGNLQNVISLDPLAIAHTEVLFGPGSVVYGSDAIGGVMSFQTLTAPFALGNRPAIGGRAFTRRSSANRERTAHADLLLGWKQWSSTTSFTHSAFGDLRMGRHGPADYLKPFYILRIDSTDRIAENPDPRVQVPTGYEQVNLMQKVRFRPSGRWDLHYGFHYSETSSFSRYDRLIETRPDGRPVSAVWNYGPQIWMMHALTASHRDTTGLYDALTLRLAQQRFEESRIDRRFGQHRLRTQMEKVLATSANLDMEKNIRRHRIDYGAEFVFNAVASTGTAVDIRSGTPIPVPDRYPASTWRSLAAYVNDQFQASDRWLLQAGLRHSAFGVDADFSRHLSFFPFDFTASSVRSSATTGGVGAVYLPDSHWKLSANAGTGFRAPNVDDMGKLFDFAAGEVVVPNTNLKAEYAWNAEASAARIIGDFIRLDVTAFYTRLQNAMVRRAFQVNGQDSILFDGQMSAVYAIQNAAFGTVLGINAGADIRLPAGFRLSTRFNFQRGREEIDSGAVGRSRHAAPAFGNTRITFQDQKLTLQLYAEYSAGVAYANLNEEERQKPFIYAKDKDGNPHAPAWYTLNLKAMYRFDAHFSVSVGVENLSDQRYRPYSSGLAAPGSNVVLALTGTF